MRTNILNTLFAATVLAGAASASPITFANFNNTLFTWTSTSTTGDLSASGTGGFNFSNVNNLPVALQGNLHVVVTYGAHTTTAGGRIVLGPPFNIDEIAQPLSAPGGGPNGFVLDNMTINLDPTFYPTGYNGLFNLLTVDFQVHSGSLLASTFSHNMSLTADTANQGGGFFDYIVYTSDFMTLPSSENAFSMSWNNFNPCVTLRGGTCSSSPLSGFIASSTGTFTGSGQFSIDPAPNFGAPEPSTWIYGLTGIGAVCLGALRRRNRKAA